MIAFLLVLYLKEFFSIVQYITMPLVQLTLWNEEDEVNSVFLFCGRHRSVLEDYSDRTSFCNAFIEWLRTPCLGSQFETRLVK